MNKPLTRDQRRRRKREVKAQTISVSRLTKSELREGRRLYPETDYWRPRTRGDCFFVPRPCPFVSCRYNTYLDVSYVNGTIKLNFPDLEVCDPRDSCVLDIAARGGVTLEEIGAIMNITRERARQLEMAALARLVEKMRIWSR